MTVRLSAIAATLCVSLCAPLAANAAGGTIRFVGAIVEEARCEVSTVGRAAKAVPQVNCSAPGGGTLQVTDKVVKVSTKVLPSLPGVNGGPERQRRLVLLLSLIHI